MLTDRINVVQAKETVEDVFSSSLGLIFPNDTQNLHGDPGAIVVYKSPGFGELKLTVADPDEEESRRLFAHYLWNAGVWTAARIEDATAQPGLEQWIVKGERVLELGAGVGLTGIVSYLSGALHTVVSDYPAPEVLQNIKLNVQRNVAEPGQRTISVAGHEWGRLDQEQGAELVSASFTKIFASDCLWMPWQHQNLAKSMAYFLSDAPQARVFVVAGFHTGRAKVAPFFDVVQHEGFEVEEIYEEDVHGTRREWAQERDGGREDVTERKKWLVVAILKKRRKG